MFFKSILSIALLLTLNICQGQSLSRSVISSGGSNNDLLSYTLGESVTATASGSDLTLAQGFQQPDELWATSVDPLLGKATFRLYPNPTREKLILEIESEESRKIGVEFIDVRGRKVSKVLPIEIGSSTEHTFDVSSYAVGTYLLLLKDGSGKILNSFRFQKRF